MAALAGKTAIVTGAAQGIGKAVAMRFVAEGARVALIDVDEATLGRAVEAIGNRASAIMADVGDEQAVASAVSAVLERLGGLDILVNNAAARSPKRPITELSLDEWERALRINLTGAFLMTRAVLPVMERAERGIIINIASQLGSVGVPQTVPYCTTKGGMLQFTRALALDCAPLGIRVNSLSPGAVMTERLTRIYGNEAAVDDALGPKHPIGRVGQPEEIAAAAVFLASSESTFMTGADLVVDGGYIAQ